MYLFINTKDGYEFLFVSTLYQQGVVNGAWQWYVYYTAGQKFKLLIFVHPVI